MIASRSMRMAPSTDCSASRLCGGRRSITAWQDSGGWLGASWSGRRARRVNEARLVAASGPRFPRPCGPDVDIPVDIHAIADVDVACDTLDRTRESALGAFEAKAAAEHGSERTRRA